MTFEQKLVAGAAVWLALALDMVIRADRSLAGRLFYWIVA